MNEHERKRPLIRQIKANDGHVRIIFSQRLLVFTSFCVLVFVLFTHEPCFAPRLFRPCQAPFVVSWKH